MIGRFTSPWQAQRFLSAHGQIGVVFRPSRYRLSATSYSHARTNASRISDDYAVESKA